MISAPWMAHSGDRRIPYDICDAVEMWARQWGRHGTVRWNGVLNCPEIQLTLKPDDPRMKQWQQQKVGTEPKESVLLMYQPLSDDGKNKAVHYQPMDIEQLGVSGVLEILNRGNTESGTGEFENMMAAVQRVAEQNDRLRLAMRNAAKESSRERRKEQQWYAAPKVSVPDTIK